VDPVGNIYVGELCAGIIRRISPDGTVRTFAGHRGESGIIDGIGTNATLSGYLQLACDLLGNIYAAEGSFIRKITPEGRVTTLAGGLYGEFADGEGPAARFYQAGALAVDAAGRLWIADTGNQRIRRVSFSTVPTTGFSLNMYAGLSITGMLGRSYRIEFTGSLAESNAWTPASFITLTSSPTLWFDADSPNRQNRFYRAVLLP
jgi:NHL repeat